MEIGAVLERKVAVVQESKLSPKSKNHCIRNYTTVCKDRPHGGGLHIFIHRSIIFFKQPSSPESLSDPHLEELPIKAELGKTEIQIQKGSRGHPEQVFSSNRLPKRRASVQFYSKQHSITHLLDITYSMRNLYQQIYLR